MYKYKYKYAYTYIYIYISYTNIYKHTHTHTHMYIYIYIFVYIYIYTHMYIWCSTLAIRRPSSRIRSQISGSCGSEARMGRGKSPSAPTCRYTLLTVWDFGLVGLATSISALSLCLCT